MSRLGLWAIFLVVVVMEYMCPGYGEAKDSLTGRANKVNETCDSKKIDVVFGIDASFSMRYSLKLAGEVVHEIVDSIFNHQGHRIAVFLYTDEEAELNIVVPLNNKLSPEEIKTKILPIRWEYNYGERHALAINTALKQLEENKRDYVSRNIIIVTDGETEPELKEDLSIANETACGGPNVFVVGIKTEKIEAEPENSDLLSIAGGRMGNVFAEQDASKVYKAICETKMTVDWNGNNWAKNCDFYGNDLKKARLPDGGPEGSKCRARCDKEPGCTHFTYGNYSGGTCWMKKGKVCPSDADVCPSGKCYQTHMFCGYM